jgi:hypothetical protein
MIDAGSLEFAHARIWARHGERPDEALWRRIEAAREFGAVLEIARASALARWLEGVGSADVHAIEIALRRHWRERVAEVAAWMPAAWRPAIEWCAVLVDLPALQHLARGGAPLPWLSGDPVLGALVDADAVVPAAPPGRSSTAALAAAPADRRERQALQVLLDAARPDPTRLLALWRREWQRRLPRAAGRGALQARLLPLLAAHEAAFGAPPPLDGWALRRGLQQRLSMLLRRTLIEPTTAFVHLALCALDFERLRGELLRRAAFPHRSPAT